MPSLRRLAVIALVCALLSGAAPSAFSLPTVLSYPFPDTLVSSGDGTVIAYGINQRGLRSIWVARAPAYDPRELVAMHQDDGVGINAVQLSRDGSRLVYAYGSSENPSLSTAQPETQISTVETAGGMPAMLAAGHAPALAPDGSRVAFQRNGEVWIVPTDGSAQAKRLFYDAGKDGDLQWSPNSDALAFVSSRGDHAFIGVYRGDDRPLEFLAPSVTDDQEPRWSPDGTRVAFARTPGGGGALPSPLQMPVVPWSIWIARVADGSASAVWKSGLNARASFPTQGGDVDLTWAGNARLLFLSEADNWPHLYSVSADGGPARRLTSGPFTVVSFVPDRDARTALYVVNTGTTSGDIDRWHICRVGLASGASIPVTSGYSSQWWPTPLADGNIAYVTTTAQRPPLVAISAGDGSAQRLLDAALLPADFPVAQLVTPSEVTYHALDGFPVHAQLFRSTASGRRPAIVFVHGGPMRQMLLTWNPLDYYSNSYAVNQYLVSRGYTVLSVNYRSGVGYGHDFHYAVRTGWTGASEYQDVLAGARWLQQQSFVDPKHIGIWGGSWGGYLTALALARNSDVFKAGVDYSGVHDLMHDAIDYFASGAEGSAPVDLKPWLKLAWESSPVGSMKTWRSPVLLIQGDEDPDVSFHQLVDLVPRLQQYHVPFQLMVLPDEAHGFLRWDSWVRADTAAAQFFDRYL
jgi:dipeptidyl aminopeptidase/acylaminoacyl peptidase